MLAVHWAPVSETKKIIKNGISKSKTGLYCFPLTGLKVLDKWWVNFFNTSKCRPRKRYNGFIFRITQDDMPAYLGDWAFATTKDKFEKSIGKLETLEKEYRNILLFRMGEHLAYLKGLRGLELYSEDFVGLAQKELELGSATLNSLMKSPSFMTYAFEDYQIVLSHPIAASRIISIIPQGSEFNFGYKRKRHNVKKADFTFE